MALAPNRSRFWKRCTPSSLRAAVDGSIDFAHEAHNLSMDRLAERLRLGSTSALYKRLEALNLKITEVKAFEHACGIDLLTRYFVASSGRIVIEIPTGRAASAADIQALQSALHEAVGALIQFYAGQTATEETMQAVTAAMADLAAHRINVSKYSQPELELAGEQA